MKLSLWMIANRMSELDIELHISEDAKVHLNSARRVYATNCVHCYATPEGDVICKAEEDYILLRDITLTQAFEIVQSIFDFYEDWQDELHHSIIHRDYPKFADCCSRIFRNQVILFDSDYHVLGMSSAYSEMPLDEEWSYLMKYRWMPSRTLRQIRGSQGVDYEQRPGIRSYKKRFTTGMNYDSVHYAVGQYGDICGRITILQSDRELNQGDYQILQRIVEMWEPVVRSQIQIEGYGSGDVLLDLILGRPYYEKRLLRRIGSMNWKAKENYSLAIVRPKDFSDKKTLFGELHIVKNLIEQNSINCAVFLHDKPGALLILYRGTLKDHESQINFLFDICKNNPIRAGFSMDCSNILDVSLLLGQAKMALHLGMTDDREKCFYFFEDYAVEYILFTNGIENKLQAVMPAVKKLWYKSATADNELYETLKCYLNLNCSVTRTAEAMFTHRNTVQYRIRKIQEMMDYDFDNVYCIDYCKLSVRILEYYEKRYGKEMLMQKMHLY